VPILLAAAFGAIFRQPGEVEAIRVPVLLVLERPAETDLERRILAGLHRCERLAITVCDEAQARRRLARRQANVVLLLPAGLERMSLLGGPAQSAPTVRVLRHPSHALESRLVEGLFTEIALREAAATLLAPVLGPAPTPLQKPFVVAHATVPDVSVLGGNAFAHSFCGMTLQYLLFWGMDSGLLLLRERRQGIWRRLRAAPVRPATLLAGKALATALVALAQILTTFTVGWLLFGVTINGSLLGFFLLAVAAAVLAAATGLVVAALGGTESRARSVAIVVILTLSMLGGLWLPSFLLPQWVQRAALALPTTWAARGFDGVVWQAMPLAAAAQCALILLLFSGAFLVLANWGFRRVEMIPGETR
jgi:ABC-2 type transport system permease protein